MFCWHWQREIKAVRPIHVSVQMYNVGQGTGIIEGYLIIFRTVPENDHMLVRLIALTGNRSQSLCGINEYDDTRRW